MRDTEGTIGILMDRFPDDNIHGLQEYDREVAFFQNELVEKGLPEIDSNYVYPSLFSGTKGLRIWDLTALAVKAIIEWKKPTAVQMKLDIARQLLERYPQIYTVQGIIK
jgi:hypothetical protein